MQEYADISLEKKVLAYYIRKDVNLPIVLEHFTIDIGRDLLQFVQQGLKSPSDSFSEWWELWEIHLKRTNKGQLSSCKRFLRSLFAEECNESKINFFVEELTGFAEARHLFAVYKESIDKFDKGETREARQILENGLDRIRKNFATEVVDRSDFVEDWKERYDTYIQKKEGKIEKRIPIGIEKLDKKLDGVMPVSFNVVQGQTGIGKTFILQEIAWKGAQFGRNVLFVEIEMRRQEIETRWDSRLTGFKIHDIDQAKLSIKEETWWKKRIKDLQDRGKLAISHIAEGCTIKSIEREIDYWEDRWGEKISILVVDYADLMESTRKAWSEQEIQGNIFRDLKRLGQVKSMVSWTGTQTSGVSYGKSKIGIGDTGYSKKKVHGANLVIGIGGSDDDLADGILTLYVGKNSFGVKNFDVILYPDFEKAIIDLPQE